MFQNPIARVSEEEEEEQDIENSHGKIMKNFPKLAKEIHFHEVQEVQRVPKKLDPRKHTPKQIVITLPKIKDKERLLKAAREKETVALQRSSLKTLSRFLIRNLTSKKGLERSIRSHERQGPTSKVSLSSKAIILNGRADKNASQIRSS